ncbi:unnamed protein product [Lymnaea stagnalis]|uniref:Ig-like domain-containing protein n=1 Tax=Lymnaea stagnalis TaxID=6523 RepID=A0AAV2HCM1_LYMST
MGIKGILNASSKQKVSIVEVYFSSFGCNFVTMKLICVVTVLLLVQCCKALKTCDNAADCDAPAYKTDVCTDNKCQCATEWTLAGTVCNPPVPVVSRLQPNQDLYLKESYTLSCDTPVTGGGLTFSWLNGAKDLHKDSKSYVISSAQESDNGAYTCKITAAGGSSQSVSLLLNFKEPGRECTDNTKCKGTDLTGYTGQCVSGHCACANGYVQKLDKCTKSGTASITASLFVLLTATLTQLRILN